MAFSRDAWSQIKNTSAEDLKRALERDGFRAEGKRGAALGFYRPSSTPNGKPQRVVIHYHPKKTFGGKLLEGVIKDAGWSEEDLRRLKLIK